MCPSCPLAFAVFLLLAADDPSWNNKPIPQWNDEDAKQVLSDSPWVKNVKLERVRDLSKFERRDGGNMSAGIPPYVGVFWLDLSGLAGVFGSNSEEAAISRAGRVVPDL